jgi:hypothetical protein
MCPVCIATAVLMAGNVTSSGLLAGGLAAIAIKKFGVKNDVNHHPDPTPSTREKQGEKQ